MQAALAALGLQAEFVPGVDGKKLSAAERAVYDSRRCREIYGSDMRPGEIGCYLGHYRLYQRLQREGVERALILEDDVLLDPVLPQIMAAIERVPLEQWSIIHLRSGRGKVYSGEGAAFAGTELARFATGHRLLQLRTHILSGGAYFINQDGLRRMIDFGARIFLPIDHTMDRFWENGILPLVVRPLPVGHNNDFESSIGSHGQEHQQQALPLGERVRHRVRRNVDSIAKRLFWLGRRLSGKRV